MDSGGGFKGHLAPIMGMSCARLGVKQEDCTRLFLFIALRLLLPQNVSFFTGVCLRSRSLHFQSAAPFDPRANILHAPESAQKHHTPLKPCAAADLPYQRL
jgi:hypothetical protein